MKLSLSNYEIVLPLDESHTLLVNGLYGAIDVVDRAEAEALSQGEIERLDGEELERLKARGHLSDSAETELEDLKILAGIYRKILAERQLGLHILPTYDCNFRCPYCYEKHRLSCGEEWLKKPCQRRWWTRYLSLWKRKKSGYAAYFPLRRYNERDPQPA